MTATEYNPLYRNVIKRGSKVAEWVKTFATESDYLGLILRCTWGKEENDSSKMSFDSHKCYIAHSMYMYIHRHISK